MISYIRLENFIFRIFYRCMLNRWICCIFIYIYIRPPGSGSE